MEYSERPHLTATSSGGSSSCSTGTSELFICFTSRLSSSSMKISSSKSILSPGRAREPSSQISLSSSLSRRLKSSGSLKSTGAGQASPMFPTGGKKRTAFENPEPSSPKVTCIGQVRVKTKKQSKKMRSRSSSNRRSGHEASFRRAEQALQEASNHSNNNSNTSNSTSFQLQQQQGESTHSGLPHRNQKWVHLPLTICEALRAFGAEFNCFLPCRSSCMNANNKEEKSVRSENSSNNINGSSSCGAALARWLVSLQDGDHGKGREIELVVGDDEEEAERTVEKRSFSSQRRQVFEGIEFKDEPKVEEEEEEEEEEEKGRVSICIPPKNALLLMRCRSDPVKMAALANRFWESPAPTKDEDQEEEGDEEVEKEHEELKCEQVVQEGEVVESEVVVNGGDEDGVCEKWVCSDEETPEGKPDLGTPEKDEDEDRDEVVAVEAVENRSVEIEKEKEPEEDCEEEKEQERLDLVQPESLETGEETDFNASLTENVVVLDPEEKVDLEENEVKSPEQDQELEEENDMSSLMASVQSKQEPVENEEEEEEELKVKEGSTEMEEEEEEEETPETVTQLEEESESESESEPEDPKTNDEKPGLPDCLLLMMCEPKLSMEVSKETWVCSTDFIRWLPERRANPKKVPAMGLGPGSEEPKKRPGIAVNGPNAANVAHQQPLQPPRSSCSFPVTAAPQSMAAMIEQKLVGSKPYEPFVLTRCKSEPMRSAAKLAPDACFWKNRKLEPHRPATLGVGAAGVGF